MARSTDKLSRATTAGGLATACGAGSIALSLEALGMGELTALGVRASGARRALNEPTTNAPAAAATMHTAAARLAETQRGRSRGKPKSWMSAGGRVGRTELKSVAGERAGVAGAESNLGTRGAASAALGRSGSGCGSFVRTECSCGGGGKGAITEREGCRAGGEATGGLDAPARGTGTDTRTERSLTGRGEAVGARLAASPSSANSKVASGRS